MLLEVAEYTCDAIAAAGPDGAHDAMTPGSQVAVSSLACLALWWASTFRLGWSSGEAVGSPGDEFVGEARVGLENAADDGVSCEANARTPVSTALSPASSTSTSTEVNGRSVNTTPPATQPTAINAIAHVGRRSTTRFTTIPNQACHQATTPQRGLQVRCLPIGPTPDSVMGAPWLGVTDMTSGMHNATRNDA